MTADRDWLIDQIRERLLYYRSLTAIGLRRSEAIGTARPPAAGETLEHIREDLGECTRCRLHRGRRTIVFGVGNPKARLMFVGEGPGYEEDREGLPFVGRAGQLLTRIMESVQITREEVYIANIVKCHPPGNRDPETDEIEACRPFLKRQIESVRPRVICVLGRVATQALLSTEKPMREMRGEVFRLGEALVVPTYHPAFLLRNPEKKGETWQDIKLVRALLDERQ